MVEQDALTEAILRRSWGATGWLLAGCGILLLLVLFDVGRRLLAAPRPLPAAVEAGSPPPFKVGDPAPDFELPDRTGKRHRLSSMVRRDTLVCFTCGCANCLDLQTYLAMLLKRMGKKAPDVITVTTMPREREETYIRDTGLKAPYLYEPKKGPVMALYRGHPCPRVYHLRGDRTVAWIGSSPEESQFLQLVGNELAEHLGFSRERSNAPLPPGVVQPQ